MSTLASVVIVSYNSGELLEVCAERVMQSTLRFELILVDNHSSDGVPEQLTRRFHSRDNFQMLKNSSNLGFGAACNQGLELAQGKMVVFLNPDCIIKTDTLALLYELYLKHPEVGMWGAQTLAADGSVEPAAYRREPTPARILAHGLGLTKKGWAEGVNTVAQQNEDAIQIVDATSGALMAMDSQFAKTLGGFDQGYFLHAEDLDLCRRVRDVGKQVAVAKKISITHYQGGSSGTRPFFVEWHKYRGLVRYLNLHHKNNYVARWIAIAAMTVRMGIRAPQLWLRERRTRVSFS